MIDRAVQWFLCCLIYILLSLRYWLRGARLSGKAEFGALVRDPMRAILEPEPWWSVNPITYAKALSVQDLDEMFIPPSGSGSGSTKVAIDPVVEMPADALYRLGAQQDWLALQLPEALENELQKNRGNPAIKVAPPISIRLAARPPGRRAQLVRFVK